MYIITYIYTPHNARKYHTFDDINEAIIFYKQCIKSVFKNEITANFQADIFDNY